MSEHKTIRVDCELHQLLNHLKYMLQKDSLNDVIKESTDYYINEYEEFRNRAMFGGMIIGESPFMSDSKEVEEVTNE